jgi:uroporphyrin-3 C-methyltransferase
MTDDKPRDGSADANASEAPDSSELPTAATAEQAPLGPSAESESTGSDAALPEDATSDEAGMVEQDAEPDAARTSSDPKPKGRVLAALALVFALLAACGVGYLYYLLVYLNPLGEAEASSSELATKYDVLQQKLGTDLAALEQANEQKLAEAQRAQEARLASNEKAVVKSLQEALETAPPSEKEWKLAEAQYMLRIANHRVLMEQDSIGALRLLEAADQIMAELDDFALHQVRARLADEIIALRQVRRDDLQGVYLQIEAIKSQIDTLPFATPEYLQSAPVADPDQSVWQTLYQEFKQFVRVRTIAGDESIKPLLAPEEERFVELNLRLSLEQAQLAALRRQQAVFEHSLQSVEQWLRSYLDPNDPRVTALIEATQELLKIELARPLPDISGSLNELNNALRVDS